MSRDFRPVFFPLSCTQLGKSIFGFSGFSICYNWQLIGKKNSNSKVEKVLFFIFESSYAEMSFLNEKITK
jgi:hypothetical protein